MSDPQLNDNEIGSRPSFKRRKFKWLERVLIGLGTAVILANAFGAGMWSMMIMLLCSGYLVVATVYAIGNSNIRTAILGITVICICLSVWTSYWPLNLRFQLAKSRYTAIVDQIKNGETPETPIWVSTFRVLEIELTKSGDVCFWTNDDPAGASGIVYCLDPKKKFNIATTYEFGRSWHYVSID